MKRHIFFIIVFSVLFIALTAGMMDDNGRAGYTGSPGEATCNTTNCHNSFVLNTGGGSISATSSMNNWTYDPLTTYTISIKVAKSGVALFGVGVEILTSANNNAGTITVTDAAVTQIKSRVVAGVTRRNLVHTLNGGASQDSMTFDFSWTSPDTTAGPVTMYFAGNASNSSSSRTGDYIYTSTRVISPSSGNSAGEFKMVDSFSVFPNPANKFIALHYTLQKNENVRIKLCDLQGKFMVLLLDENKPAGSNDDVISLPGNFPDGLYLLRIESSSGRFNKKLMISQ